MGGDLLKDLVEMHLRADRPRGDRGVFPEGGEFPSGPFSFWAALPTGRWGGSRAVRKSPRRESRRRTRSGQ